MHDAAIDAYLLDLESELRIRGLKQELQRHVLAETKDHLRELVTEKAPRTLEEVGRLLLEFGSPQSLAKSISAEYERAANTRRFLWPALVTPVLALVSFWGVLMPWLPLSLIGVLLILGFLARKPSIGQFVVLGVILNVVVAAWLSRTHILPGERVASVPHESIERLRLAFLLAAPVVWALCGFGLAVANTGFVLWALLRDARQVWLRFRYSRKGLSD